MNKKPKTMVGIASIAAVMLGAVCVFPNSPLGFEAGAEEAAYDWSAPLYPVGEDAGLTLSAAPEAAEDENMAKAESGTCGENLTWTFENGTLTINGTGEMNNYSEQTAPWKDHRASIRTVIINAGTVNIGNFAFFDCYNMTGVFVPDSVVNIGDNAFSGCRKLTSVDLGNGVESIYNYAFKFCSSLEEISMLR